MFNTHNQGTLDENTGLFIPKLNLLDSSDHRVLQNHIHDMLQRNTCPTVAAVNKPFETSMIQFRATVWTDKIKIVSQMVFIQFI